MVSTFTTTLSGGEISALIENAVRNALAEKSVQPLSKSNPITRRELMSRLNVSEPTLIRWERKGVIPYMEIGSHKRYDWDAVIKALEHRTGKGGARI